jgi:glycosyltransferase involved in cell wall biosynthesis
MRILHLLGWYFPDSVGGTEVYVEGLCRRLRDAGHDVLVAAPIVNGSTHTTKHDGVTVFRYAIPAQPTRDEAQQRTGVRGAAAFHEWMAEMRPDILHVHSFVTGVGLAEIREARRLGIRVIATCHLPGLGYLCRAGALMQWGTVPCDGIVLPPKCAECALTTLGMPRQLSRVIAAIPAAIGRAVESVPGRVGTTLGMSASIGEQAARQRELMQQLDAFVVLNETSRRILIANGSPAGKLVVNRLGVSQGAIAPKPGPDVRPTPRPVRFGFVGRLHRDKGLDQLVRAVIGVASDVDFVVEIRGPVLDAATRAFVKDLRAQAAADRRIVFADGVSAAEVPRVLAALDALIVPSMWFENGPTVAIESFAVGTPLIASRVGNLTELVDDGVNGRLVDPGDVVALSRALEDAARDPSATIDRWRAGIPAVRTMDDIARDYLALYAA